MDEARKTSLLENGINVDSALEHFMGNEAMLERYLRKFPSEKSYAQLVDDVAAGNREGAAIAVHTLKSVCATLGCEGMRQLVVRQEQRIRAGEWDEAVAMMPEIVAAYTRICAALRQ